jgi:membrane-bound ClpP family serine protease
MDNMTLALAMALIALGLVLLIAELFVTNGLLALVALGLLAFGIALPFIYGDTSTGIVTMMAVFIGVPGLISFLLRCTTWTPFGRRLMQPPGLDSDTTMANMPVNLELEQLRGRIGRAISPLRPSGVVDFDGKRIDTLTEGFPVDAGSWVKCVEVKAGRVIVRPVEGPTDVTAAGPSVPKASLNDLENLDFT